MAGIVAKSAIQSILFLGSVDHRSQTVEITQAGTQILRQLAREAAPFFTELFSGISEEDCVVSAGVVVKLIENLQKMEEVLV